MLWVYNHSKWFAFLVRGSTILTSKIDPRAVRDIGVNRICHYDNLMENVNI